MQLCDVRDWTGRSERRKAEPVNRDIDFIVIVMRATISRVDGVVKMEKLRVRELV